MRRPRPAIIDTHGWCTGGCCDEFALSVEGQRMTIEQLVTRQAEERRFDVGDLVSIAIPLRNITVDGRPEGVFGCSRFDRQARRCAAYSQRPLRCRAFPGGRVCGWCGFSVAKQRRAMKRFIRETVNAGRLSDARGRRHSRS